MKKCLELAKKGMGYVSPNPMVGCVVVFNDDIIGEGYHKNYGEAHAEANAILKVANSTNNCEGATLYLTLSPCKECAKLIHQSGIKRLVYIKKYKDDLGLRFLKKAMVKLTQIKLI